MQFQDDQNPYAPPTATDKPYDDHDDEMHITATRGSRWLVQVLRG